MFELPFLPLSSRSTTCSERPPVGDPFDKPLLVGSSDVSRFLSAVRGLDTRWARSSPSATRPTPRADVFGSDANPPHEISARRSFLRHAELLRRSATRDGASLAAATRSPRREPPRHDPPRYSLQQTTARPTQPHSGRRVPRGGYTPPPRSSSRPPAAVSRRQPAVRNLDTRWVPRRALLDQRLGGTFSAPTPPAARNLIGKCPSTVE